MTLTMVRPEEGSHATNTFQVKALTREQNSVRLLNMFSLERLFRNFGDNKFSDRLEMLTYNALPGTTTPDFWAHQYDQAISARVLVSAAKRDWSSNGDYSNIYRTDA